MTASAKVALAGSTPLVRLGVGNPEAEKYGRLWAMPEYRQFSPGQTFASVFLHIARPSRGAAVIDFGCGAGRGALMMSLLGGLRVTMVDFVRNCLDPEIQEAVTTQPHALAFLKHDLEQPLPVAAQYGFCADVMEHVPPERVDRVLSNILKAAQHVFFSISTADDRCGALIGEVLHLTVRPHAWWLEKFQERGCLVHWAREESGGSAFYVTAWASGHDVVNSGVINVEESAMREQARQNIAAGWKQIHPAGTNDREIMLIGGGPSLTQFADEIKQRRADGVHAVTFNGAYHWARERGVWPVNQMVVDARAFNARFTHPPDPACMYFIASICHPSVLEGLPRDRTWLYHAMPGLIKDVLDEHYGAGGWHAVPGGSSVLLRAIPLFRMLGYRRMHLYGCDSCLVAADGRTEYSRGAGGTATMLHHAYAQPENESSLVIPVTVGAPGVGSDRIFWCHPWMISQAQEFLYLIRTIGDTFELEVHGDGLLAHLLRVGADSAAIEEGGAVDFEGEKSDGAPARST